MHEQILLAPGIRAGRATSLLGTWQEWRARLTGTSPEAGLTAGGTHQEWLWVPGCCASCWAWAGEGHPGSLRMDRPHGWSLLVTPTAWVS